MTQRTPYEALIELVRVAYWSGDPGWRELAITIRDDCELPVWMEHDCPGHWTEVHDTDIEHHQRVMDAKAEHAKLMRAYQ